MTLQDSRSKFIELLHQVIPEDYLVASHSAKLKENFWIDLMQSKDEYIISMSTIGMFQESFGVLVDFIETYIDNTDFMFYLKLQIDFHVTLYSLYFQIINYEEASISPFVRNKASEILSQEDMDYIKKLIGLYNDFISAYNTLTDTEVQIERDISDDIFYVIQNFKNKPEDITKENHMKIEKIFEFAKRAKIQIKYR